MSELILPPGLEPGPALAQQYTEALGPAQGRFAMAIDIWHEALTRRQLVPGSLAATPAAWLIARHNGFALTPDSTGRDYVWADPHRSLTYQWWSSCAAAGRQERHPAPPPPWVTATGYSARDLYQLDIAFDTAVPTGSLLDNFFEGEFDPHLTRLRLGAAISMLADILHLPGALAENACQAIDAVP